MIRYSLVCDDGHDFEGWFRDSATFERQAAEGLISCPYCASTKVTRGVMAPHVSRSSEVDFARLRAALRTMRDEMIESAEDVGDHFPDEARKIADGDADRRTIRGRATFEEAKALLEDGIEILAIPELPSDGN